MMRSTLVSLAALLALGLAACDDAEDDDVAVPDSEETEEPEYIGQGSGEFSWVDEELEVRGVDCHTDLIGGDLEMEVVEAVTTARGRLRVLFDPEAEVTEMVALEFDDREGPNETYRAHFTAREVEGEVNFEPGVGASGTVVLAPGSRAAGEANPDGGEVRFDLAC